MEDRTYKIALSFGWAGGCLWSKNDAAFKRFDVGPIQDRLGLSDHTLEKLTLLELWYNTSLNWETPPDPGPWRRADYDVFEEYTRGFLEEIRSQLGGEFYVYYDNLNGYQEPDKPQLQKSILGRFIGR